jgi:hypothetical protein
MMTSRSVWCPSLVLALGALALPAAAAPGAPQEPKPETGAVASVTATGCLDRWSAVKPDLGNGAPVERPPAGVQFVLTARDGETPATTPDAARSGTGKRYLLLDNPNVNYAAHLRHTVTVVGTIAPQPAPGASAEDRAIDPSARETNLPQRPEPAAYQMNLVEVASLKMVSADCKP